jgi:2-C-methyl-D-erythritol 4-phosphate cytidylyltransferase
VALVPAAGSGSRFGASQPKQLSTLLGQPMIVLSVSTLLEHPALSAVYVVLAHDDDRIEAVLPAHDKLRILQCGGRTRQESVLNGLQAMQDEDEQPWVLVHDAARPGLTHAMLDRLIAVCSGHAVGGLLAMPVSDTLKRARQADIHQGSQTPEIQETVSRKGLWAAQTPQMFRRNDLLKALRHAAEHSMDVTDEASAIEAMGKQPVLVMGSLRNWKVTYATDLKMVETLIQLDI